MLNRIVMIAVILTSGVSVFAQNQTYPSPNKELQALIIPVGARGYEAYESRVEIRARSGRLLRRRSFVSRDHNHGEGVGHAEWTLDGRFFVFNTNSSGGHQPWHVATYFYSVRSNKLYSLDALVGPVTSDFKVDAANTLLTTRLNIKDDEKKPVRTRLDNWR